jgi:AraC-like DNA-binding protein
MQSYALTKARSMGPVAEMVERAGGSLTAVFRRADLPLRLIDQPDRLILLEDQFALVESAAREIGDDALGARLATEAGFVSLGAFGRRIESMPDLGAAISCVNATIGPSLQSSTVLGLEISAGLARWTYRVTEKVEIGRQKNEMLALGYMLDLVRCFVGTKFVPTGLELGGPPVVGKSAVESVYRADLFRANSAAILFPSELLETPNPRRPDRCDMDLVELPDPTDFIACAKTLIDLALLEHRPGIDWLSSRLKMSKRTLQRRLAAEGTSFENLLGRVALARACDLLLAGAEVTAVAFELGYSDPAHFTRAFKRVTGENPRAWRRAAAEPG